MGKVAPLVALFSAFSIGCEDAGLESLCTDDVSGVAVDQPLEALGGDDALTRFDGAATKPWDCTVTWLALPSTIGTAEPAASSSALELVLTRTSETARYRKFAPASNEQWSRCQEDAVFVPCSLGLTSEDGALDEAIECELRLEGKNTLMNLGLGAYEFRGSHTVTFVDDIPPDEVELNLVFTPAVDPTRIDGSIIESGTRPGRGSDPFVTTALIECTAL